MMRGCPRPSRNLTRRKIVLNDYKERCSTRLLLLFSGEVDERSKNTCLTPRQRKGDALWLKSEIKR